MKRIFYVIDEVKIPAILVDEHTFIKKDSGFLDIRRSKETVEGEVVSGQNKIHGIELRLNKAGQALALEELAAMSVAEFAKYLHIEGGY